MPDSVIAEEFLSEFDARTYPDELISRYEILECLSHSTIGETLLIEQKSSGGRFICKVYTKEHYSTVRPEDQILSGLRHAGLPRFEESFEAGERLYVVREYVEGTSLKELLSQGALTEDEIRSAAVQLCDILSYLHGNTPPVIHRDIKPGNVVLNDGKVFLIDFGISRIYDKDAGSDTVLLGTQDFAPPEQYGFAQTDCRSDIYSLGVLLRVLITGSAQADGKIKNRQMAKVVKRCTSLDPSRRYKDAAQVKYALLLTDPKKYRRRVALIALPIAAAVIIISAVGWNIYKQHHTPVDWNTNTPAYISSEDIIEDSISYLNERYDTDFFTNSNEVADIGYIKSILTTVYGFDSEYINALPNEPDNVPRENDNNFFPWGFADDEKLPREILIYTVVKAYWPEVVADWSSLTDDTGMYPGVRVAKTFADEHNLLDNMNKYADITLGEVAIVFCAAEREFSGQE
ncbi:MAG: serine/threonine protein kinase [Clostridia bacterium]|nr:serine/threonine protein kinase [Clostridia bacterium]